MVAMTVGVEESMVAAFLREEEESAAMQVLCATLPSAQS